MEKRVLHTHDDWFVVQVFNAESVTFIISILPGVAYIFQLGAPQTAWTMPYTHIPKFLEMLFDII